MVFSDHFRKADSAESTAAPTSSDVPSGMESITSPVAGFNTSRHSSLAEGTSTPFMRMYISKDTLVVDLIVGYYNYNRELLIRQRITAHMNAMLRDNNPKVRSS
jgi:hypothetical protein